MLKTKKDQIVSVLLFLVIGATGYILYTHYLDNHIETEFKECLAVDTLEAYEAFIEKYRNTKHAVDIIYYRDKRAFENAKALDTFESYQGFLNKYPRSAWLSNVTYHRDRTALELAKKSRRLQSIVDFFNNYPKSRWLPQANYYLRHQFGFNNLAEAELRLPEYN